MTLVSCFYYFKQEIPDKTINFTFTNVVKKDQVGDFSSLNNWYSTDKSSRDVETKLIKKSDLNEKVSSNLGISSRISTTKEEAPLNNQSSSLSNMRESNSSIDHINDLTLEILKSPRDRSISDSSPSAYSRFITNTITKTITKANAKANDNANANSNANESANVSANTNLAINDQLESSVDSHSTFNTSSIMELFFRDNPRPRYPISSRENGEQGRVILRACFNQNGEINDLRIVRSSGFQALDRSAFKTIKKWKFWFDERSKFSQKMCFNLPINFILN